MILVQLVQNVLTEFSNFAIGHHHILTVIVYHNGEIPPPPYGDINLHIVVVIILLWENTLGFFHP